jgi:hypothetical protein
MWAFASRRFRTYLLLAVGAPVAAAVLDQVGKGIEQRRGPSGVTRTLRSAERQLQRFERGPLARARAQRRRAAEDAAG